MVLFDGTDLFDNSAYNNTQAHELMQAIAALGGLFNRAGPAFFLNATATDEQWLSWLQQPGRWLAGITLVPAADLDSLITALVQRQPNVLKGVVLYAGASAGASDVECGEHDCWCGKPIASAGGRLALRPTLREVHWPFAARETLPRRHV